MRLNENRYSLLYRRSMFGIQGQISDSLARRKKCRRWCFHGPARWLRFCEVFCAELRGQGDVLNLSMNHGPAAGFRLVQLVNLIRGEIRQRRMSLRRRDGSFRYLTIRRLFKDWSSWSG